jgi:hypothetical protein
MKTGSQLGSVVNVAQKLKRQSDETSMCRAGTFGSQLTQINPIPDIPLIGMIWKNRRLDRQPAEYECP